MIKKIHKSCDIHLEFSWHHIFSLQKSVTFVISRNPDIDCMLIHNFWFFWLSFKSLKVVLVTMITIMLARLATLGLKIKVFWNKGYDIIISVYGVINNFLSHDSNHTADVVIWLRFGNTCISAKDFIITLIL